MCLLINLLTPFSCSQMTSEPFSSHRCTAAGSLSQGTAWSSIMGRGVNAKRGHPETDWIETSTLKVVCSKISRLSLMCSVLLLVLYIDCPPQGQNKPRVQTFVFGEIDETIVGLSAWQKKTLQTDPQRALRFSDDILLALVEVTSRYKFHFRNKIVYIS